MPFDIDGAALEVRTPNHPFPYPTARAFQAEYLDWLHDPNDDSIAVLQAPTGGGKTAAFTQLIRDRTLTVVIYPTNALMEQQCDILEENDDISVFVLNADTLREHGYMRAKELESIFKPHQGHDVIVTNPDILQAVIQNMYVDYNASLMRIFDRVDGVVYDEFHAYDSFAASGLLLQLKIFNERRPNAKLTLASATPRDDYLDFLENHIGIPTTRISSTYAPPSDPHADQFRYPITMHTHGDSMWDSRNEIADQLQAEINTAPDLSEPRIALIFNSAYESNRFYEHLSNNYQTVYDHCEKDNGYETKSDITLDDEFYILNTTSKGEVGLDYDLTGLYLDNPFSAAQFIQRVGRAGRASPATIHVHDIGSLTWPGQMSYEQFLDRIWDEFADHTVSNDQLQGLTALRAAHAVWSRETEDNNFNPELYEDFANITDYGRWYGFIDDVVDAANTDYTSQSLMQTQPSGKTMNLLDVLTTAIDALSTLRGRTVSHDITYPRGDREVATEYDLISALRGYNLEDVTDDRLELEPSPRDQSVRIHYEGLPDAIELDQSLRDHYGDVLAAINEQINGNEANIRDVIGHTETEILQFLAQLMGVQYSAIPARIRVANYELEPQENGDMDITQLNTP